MFPSSFVLVESGEDLVKALQDISHHSKVAFDAEGVDLGRDGPLTVATFLGLDDDGHDSPVYVVDVQTIGGDRVFSTKLPSFRGLLESGDITKVAFDCRGNSDALFHQFGVKLAGVLDLQVLDQAVRIHLGEAPPRRCPYVTNDGISYLQSMRNVLERNLPLTTAEKLPAPHSMFSSTTWATRPMTALALEYAANDVYIIKILWKHLHKFQLSDSLRNALKSHSQRYEGMFRDRHDAVQRYRDSDFIREEHPIVVSDTLPNSNPRKPDSDRSEAGQKWDEVVRQLEAKNGRNDLFHQVMFILQHDDLYTDEAAVVLRRLAAAFPFTPKQRAQIADPPNLRGDDEYDGGENYNSYCDDGYYLVDHAFDDHCWEDEDYGYYDDDDYYNHNRRY